jgi:hypothetical protein
MDQEFWITIAAIILGPLVAVIITVVRGERRQKYDSRHAVFRSLMKTRRTWANPEHVEALNLVEIEFHGKSKVLKAYKDLFNFFVQDNAKRSDEDDESYLKRKAEHHSDLLSALLLEMSKDLGYRHDQLEILRGGYSPVLHGQIEEDQEKIRKLFAGLYDGSKAIPVALIDVRHPEQLLSQAYETQALLQYAQSKNEGEKDG